MEHQLGAQVIEAVSQAGGFSPGVAARLRLADGRRAFVKAVGPDANPDTPRIYRREAQIAAALPPTAPAPRLLCSYDEGEAGWVVLVAWSWLLHILVDLPTHAREPWGPRPLWPLSDLAFDGVGWAELLAVRLAPAIRALTGKG